MDDVSENSDLYLWVVRVDYLNNTVCLQSGIISYK